MEIISACFDTKFFQTKVFDHAKWTIKLIDRIFLIGLSRYQNQESTVLIFNSSSSS